ncbi:helix-turn-helix transcriptional regulator [Loigolactobacillus jiayinensis]|uniref:Transcriptional regulator n=1 Tax=Loigolactobacillus jiayinensis TaxID=2486016 RepID=A0ABW1RFT4_9LACO|nr:PAS domain-containing protein [Loigolactobacillus jiayinensis]
MVEQQLIHEYIQQFVPMIDFLAEILGENSEVLLNDLTDLDHSVVAIRNADISHRKVGDPATDLALRTVQAGKIEQRDFLANYEGVIHNHHKLCSSTYFIRYEGEIVAMICINTDNGQLDELQKAVTKVIDGYNHLKPNAPKKAVVNDVIEPEHLTSSIHDLATSEAEKVCKERGVSVDYLKRDDKLEIIRRLQKQGYFLLKDAVSSIAKVIKVSEPSIYRYLQMVKDEAV